MKCTSGGAGPIVAAGDGGGAGLASRAGSSGAIDAVGADTVA
jgi:hypothetical protein